MSADNRTVATDALATLGTIITEKEKRDAIHLAVIPVVAGQALAAGADVYIGKDGCAYHVQMFNKPYDYIGIVDPFLKSFDDSLPIKEGDRFWLVIYPRTITSLRHVWEHPAFPNEDGQPKHSPQEVHVSRMLIEAVADDAGLSYVDLMREIEEAVKGGWDSLASGYGYEPDAQLNETFWRAWSICTGNPVPNPDTRPKYFSCSC